MLRLNVPVNNFSVMSGRSHRFLGNQPVLSGSKVSCSRTQHGGGRSRTPDLSLRSPTRHAEINNVYFADFSESSRILTCSSPLVPAEILS